MIGEAVTIDSGLFAVVIGALLAGGSAVVGWTVNLLWRTTTALSRIEERMDDMERRMDAAEAKTP